MKKVVVLTGAGMSADSGLKTFRDSNGLWEGYNVQDVATVEGWIRDPQQVLNFYNKRRKQAWQAKPNAGHIALTKLETKFEVSIVTQNVDNLHERAGSSRILHLHGELSKVRSEKNASLVYDIGDEEISLGDTAEDGAQLRPHVVWFGEMVPKLDEAAREVASADILIVIGTSLVVYPAAGLVNYARDHIPKYIVDPARPELYNFDEWRHIEERAEVGTPFLVEQLI